MSRNDRKCKQVLMFYQNNTENKEIIRWSSELTVNSTSLGWGEVGALFPKGTLESESLQLIMCWWMIWQIMKSIWIDKILPYYTQLWFYPLRVKLAKGIINIRIYVISFPHTETSEVVENILHEKQWPINLTYSIMFLWMTWRRIHGTYLLIILSEYSNRGRVILWS